MGNMAETVASRILDYVTRNGEASVADLASTLGVERAIVKATIRKMGLDGRLRQKITYVLGPGKHKKPTREPVPPITPQEMAFFRKAVKIWGRNKVARGTGLAIATCVKLLNGDMVSDVTVRSLRKIVEGGMELVKAGVEAQGAIKAVRAPRKAVQGVVEGPEGAGGFHGPGVSDAGVDGDAQGGPAHGRARVKAPAHRPRKPRPKLSSPERDAKAEDLLRTIAASEKPMRLSEVAVALGKKSRDASSYFKVAEELVYKGKLAKDPSVTPSTYSISYATDTTRNAVTVMGVRFSVEVVDRKIYKEVVLTADGQPRMSRACHDGNIEATTEMLVDSIKRRMVQS